MLGVCGYYRGVGEGSPVLLGTAGLLFGVGGQVAVCEPELSVGGVEGDWGVLLRRTCGLLTYACVV